VISSALTAQPGPRWDGSDLAAVGVGAVRASRIRRASPQGREALKNVGRHPRLGTLRVTHFGICAQLSKKGGELLFIISFFGRDSLSGCAAPRRSLSRGDRTCMRCASKGPQIPSRTAAEKRELWAKRGFRGPHAARGRERYRRALEAGAPEHKKQKEPSRVEQRDR
jgi:hypothetical protein